MEKVTLYKRGKKNKVLEWSVWIEEDKLFGIPVLVRESGFIDGKRQTKRKYIRAGNNKGKANEKTPMDVAIHQMNNLIKDSVEDNMVYNVLDIDNPPTYIKPALAKGYDEKKVKFPCYVQPKFNGVRAFSLRHLGDNRILSRQRHEFPGIDHIVKESDRLFDNYSPDGEVYKHGWSLQKISSFTKKFADFGQNPDYPESSSLELEYHVYDLAMPNMSFLSRHLLIPSLIHDTDIAKIVETIKVNNHEEIKKWHDHFVALGYEGLIIRDCDSEYAFNDRNFSLIKYKEFFDAEFKIVGHEEEEWDDAGTIRFLVVWVCKNTNGKEFKVRPTGSFIERERLCAEGPTHYGKMLTVRYQEFSDDGAPVFGVGKGFAEGEAIRDYE